jgi:HEAT repeat protein
VIPAVAGAFLFSSIRARLIFGWAFAGAISLIGLETARRSQLDPGPTIVCLFALALVVLGVGLFLRTRKLARNAILQVVGFAVLFALFLGGTLMFRKPQRTDELATAIEFAKSGDPTRERQAMVSFRKSPDAKARWIPLVIDMLDDSDLVAREAAASLLGETKATEAVEPLAARLGSGIEPNDAVRESVVRALREIGDRRAVHPLVEAADREVEPDLAVAMSVAAFELAQPGQDADLRAAVDVLARVMADTGAPRASRRDASDAMRAHVALDHTCTDDVTAVAWWKAHREAVTWRAVDHKLAPPEAAPASGG